MRLKSNDKLENILSCCSMVMLCGFCYNIMTMGALLIKNFLLSNLCMCFGLAFSFIILPLILLKEAFGIEYEEIIDDKINYVHIVIEVILLIVIFSLFGLKLQLIVFNIFVGYSEEFLFREVVFNKLGYTYNIKQQTVISALIFALLLHMNANIISNLVVRVPLGILFAMIKQKVGYSEAGAFHCSYNLFIIGLLETLV